jgi:hypothetical protein
MSVHISCIAAARRQYLSNRRQSGHHTVVNKHIELPKNLHVLLDSLLAIAFVPQVELHEVRLPASLFDLLLDELRILLFLWQVHDTHICSFSREQDSDCAADTRVSAGDEGGFSLHQAAAFIFFEVRLVVLVPELEARPFCLLLHLGIETWTAGLVLRCDLGGWIRGNGAFVAHLEGCGEGTCEGFK